MLAAKYELTPTSKPQMEQKMIDHQDLIRVANFSSIEWLYTYLRSYLSVALRFGG